jgi:hypothetical protein
MASKIGFDPEKILQQQDMASSTHPTDSSLSHASNKEVDLTKISQQQRMDYYTRLLERPHSITIKANPSCEGLLYPIWVKYPEYRDEITEWCKRTQAQNNTSLWSLYCHGVVNRHTTTFHMADGRVFYPPHSSTYMELFDRWQTRLAINPASLA